jgi:hypothetical protein
LRADPTLADAMGAAGRAYVEREYTWDAVLTRYETLLEETVARVGPAIRAELAGSDPNTDNSR